MTIETNSVVQYHLEAGVRTKERNKKYVILVEVVTVGSTAYKIIFSQSFTMNLWGFPKKKVKGVPHFDSWYVTSDSAGT